MQMLIFFYKYRLKLYSLLNVLKFDVRSNYQRMYGHVMFLFPERFFKIQEFILPKKQASTNTFIDCTYSYQKIKNSKDQTFSYFLTYSLLLCWNENICFLELLHNTVAMDNKLSRLQNISGGPGIVLFENIQEIIVPFRLHPDG